MATWPIRLASEAGQRAMVRERLTFRMRLLGIGIIVETQIKPSGSYKPSQGQEVPAADSADA